MSRRDGLPDDMRPDCSGGVLAPRTVVEVDEPVSSFLGRMLGNAAGLGLTPNEEDVARDPNQQDFVHPLLDAFATTMHVLSFYQGRMLEEGFIGSANEARSVFEIARLVGVKRRPAMCAESFVHMEAVDIPGDGEPMEIAVGLPMQSVPIKGGMPQVYETTEAVTVHPDWNRISPSPERKTAATRLFGSSVGVVVRGSAIGIGPNTPVLVSGEIDGEAITVIRVIRRVGRLPRRAMAVLLWDEALLPTQLEVEFTRPRVTELSKALSLFGADAADWDTMSLADQLRFSEAVGGFFRRDKVGGTWERGINPGKVCCLFTATDGMLYAGLIGGGVARSVDGQTWVPANTGIRAADVLCVSEDATGSLIIGTRTKGAFRSPDQGATWNALQGVSSIVGAWPRVKRVDARLPDTPVRCLMGFTDPSGKRSFVLAGTDAGLFSFDQIDGHWRPVNEGFLGFEAGGKEALVSVRGIVANPGTGTVFAATDQGLFSAARLNKPWRPRAAAAAGVGISCVTIDGSGILYAGLDGGGAVMSEDNGINWTAMGLSGRSPLGDRKVHQILAVRDDSAGREWIITATNDGVHQSTDRGVRWAPQTEALTSQDIRAVALSAKGALFVASPISGVVDSEWPGFALGPTRLDLAKPLSAGVGAREGLIEMVSDDGTEVSRVLLCIDQTQVVDVDSFDLHDRVSSLRLTEPLPELAPFQRRSSSVRLAKREMRLSINQIVNVEAIVDTSAALDPILAEPGIFDHMLTDRVHLEDVPRSSIFVDAALPKFTGRRLGIVGRRLRLTVTEPLTLVGDDSNLSQTYPADTIFEVQSWPTETDEGELRWTLADPLGFIGGAVVSADHSKLLPAEVDAPTVGLIRRVAVAAHRNGGTHLEFDSPLEIPLDLQGCVIHGNVAHVQHGQRVREVVGGGDAGVGNQAFPLRQSPLSWHDVDGVATPDIVLQVSGRPWRYVASLDEAAPDAPEYTVDIDHAGVTWIRFGDGLRGSRLPSGSENVVAWMRIGSGEDGNVEQGHIRLLRERPPMVRRVLNLVPASGGTALENAEGLRRRLPIIARMGPKVVSLADVENHVRATPGVEHVLVETVWGGDRPVLSLTVTTNQATSAHRLTPEDPLYSKLHQKVDGMGMLGQTVHIAGYTPCPFALGLHLLVEEESDTDEIRDLIQSTMQALFAFENRTLGQPVTTTEIIAASMCHPGVLNVSVHTLKPVHGVDSTPRLVPVLYARGAHWSTARGALVPAELLLLETGFLTVDIECERRL
jgi:hypothetical protein